MLTLAPFPLLYGDKDDWLAMRMAAELVDLSLSVTSEARGWFWSGWWWWWWCNVGSGQIDDDPDGFIIWRMIWASDHDLDLYTVKEKRNKKIPKEISQIRYLKYAWERNNRCKSRFQLPNKVVVNYNWAVMTIWHCNMTFDAMVEWLNHSTISSLFMIDQFIMSG